ncbi:uncharacterized protein LOC101854700 [Aplysia californica]|uniref:Uncharacterized protein LOC101854700 n=1 Tax=Aplysia californica TaxID=6500 RepID=A0ABM1VPN0_APLCA|nr:uncharacterized protein LOC101854700 [Aplysia californica]
MWKNVTSVSFLLGLLSLLSLAAGVRKGPYDVIIQRLFQKVAEEQAPEDIPFVPFEHFHRKKGVFASHIKQNFHGNLEMAEARRVMGVYDNNMFATAWITSSLMEAYLYSGAPKPSTKQLNMAIDSMADHHDKNKDYDNSLMTFWEQIFNKNTSYYQSTPYNLLEIFKEADKLPTEAIEALLEKLGLGSLAEAIKQILEGKDGYMRAFHIPPDFDDTFVNMGLGSLLYAAKTDFPDAWKNWNNQNKNLTSAFDALRKYAYRPFSDDSDVNSIDPRTYLWIRKFLDEAKAQRKNVTLVPTWIQNIDEMRTEFYKGVGMPFQINNVDATVAANTVFGITSAVLNGLVSPKVLDDPVIESLYHNTSALLAYEINTNMTNRPDVALLYYPSQIEFDWFVARSFAVMDQKRRKGPLPRPIMETVYQILKSAVEGEMTKYILSKGKKDEQGGIYYDDFLGDGDLTHDNKTLVRGEDRIFTTAMAANALLYTWTTYNDTVKNVQWRAGVPQSVKDNVKGCVDWLTVNVLGINFDPWNAFFSGSYKGHTTIPFWYPANRFEFLNGTTIHDWTHFPHGTSLLAVRGYIDSQTYEAQLKQKHFGVPSPLVFHGYNDWSGFFPLWTSTGYTYSISLLVFSRYNSAMAAE